MNYKLATEQLIMYAPCRYLRPLRWRSGTTPRLDLLAVLSEAARAKSIRSS